MINRTPIGDLKQHIGKTVSVCGFVDTIRDQKKYRFIVIRDITGKVQVIQEKGKDEQLEEALSSLTPESAVIVEGTVIEAPNVKLGGLEIGVENITISSLAETPLPIDESTSMDLRLDWRYLSLRNPKDQLVYKVQTRIEEELREHWIEEGFIEIHSPKLMPAASESGAELFSVPYFNDWTAYLAQSPQFYKQMAMAAGFEKIFEIGPVFRANPSFTSRHDTEFTSIDFEISWIDSHEDVMKQEESLLAHVLKKINEEYGEAIEEAFGTKVVVPSLPFPRITLAEARKVLAEKGHVIGHKDDLDPPGEKMLAEYIKDKYGHEFAFVTDYPTSVRPFYHMRHPENQELTLSYDLLWKGLEITTGAQREHRYEKLVAQAIDKGFATEPLQTYLDFFRYGCPPHGGCGIGLTRILMILLEQKTVREVTYIYRGPNRLHP